MDNILHLIEIKAYNKKKMRIEFFVSIFIHVSIHVSSVAYCINILIYCPKLSALIIAS